MLPRRLGNWLGIIMVAVTKWNTINAQANNPTTLFDLSFDGSVGGNCNAYNQQRFQNMVDDALTLANAGLNVVNAYGTNNDPQHARAVRLLDAWFNTGVGGLTAGQQTTIRNTYTAVMNFLTGNNGGTVNGGQSRVQPVLVCGDSWVFRQNMQDQAYGFDMRGRIVLLSNQNRSPRHINDDPLYVQAQVDTSAARGTQTYPYWSNRLGIYIFDKLYGVNAAVTDYACQGDYRTGNNMPLGLTKSRGAATNLVVLCMGAFRQNGRRLHALAPTCEDAANFVNTRPPNPNQITKITQILPDAETLFHELFHLTLGSAATRFNGGTEEEYFPSRILGKVARSDGSFMTVAQNLINPQTYTYISIAWDYTINSPQVNGHPTEWYTGYCSTQT